MTDRPIIFSGPMVRAILDGRKTQTRRVPKDPEGMLRRYEPTGKMFYYYGNKRTFAADLSGTTLVLPLPCKPGDRLWVREAWNVFHVSSDGEISWPFKSIPNRSPDADDDGRNYRRLWALDYAASSREDGPWRPSIHMPRWASRLTLPVTDVWIERVQDISEEDAIAEGFGGHPDPIGALALLWDSFNAARGYGWDTNPWVVARRFTAEQRNIDGGKDD